MFSSKQRKPNIQRHRKRNGQSLLIATFTYRVFHRRRTNHDEHRLSNHQKKHTRLLRLLTTKTRLESTTKNEHDTIPPRQDRRPNQHQNAQVKLVYFAKREGFIPIQLKKKGFTKKW